MRPEDEQLAAAMDGLYEAFASHPLRAWTEPCLACCNTRDEEAALHAVPLRQLTPEVLGEYAFNAMTTWGDEREYTHFLPRLFEIMSGPGFGVACPEQLVGALRRAGWRSWPAGEQAAVERFLAAWLRRTLAVHPSGMCTPSEVLCATGQAVDDLAAPLAAWVADGRPAAVAHLVDFVLGQYRPERHLLADPYWRERPDQAAQVVAWLHSPAVLDRLDAAAADPDGGELALRASEARYSTLTW
jgi:hypothetical protein